MYEFIFIVWACFVVATAISFSFEDGSIKERLKAALTDTLKLFGWGIAVIVIVCLPLAIFGVC